MNLKVKMENKGGQMIMLNLLFLFMTIAFLIAVIPAMKNVLDIAKQSDNLNCADYDYDNSGTVGDNVLDYNSSLESETTSCLAISLYIPYIVLIVLIGGVSKLIYSRSIGEGSSQQFQ